MNKPSPQSKTALDYHECRDYLQAKYNYNERDYDACFQTSRGLEPDSSRPYKDFWHYVLEKCDYIKNGCYFDMDKEYFLEGLEEDDFRYIITNHYFDEFGDGNPNIEFWIEW